MLRSLAAMLLVCSLMSTQACGQTNNFTTSKVFKEMMHDNQKATSNEHIDTATFAAGCFWCTEAQFQQLEGVDTVISGFTGGDIANPTYEAVCTGKTGHAEACNIIYDPTKISYDQLLAAFFTAHDPTQLNRQGNDIGTQYRSAIFYHNTLQKEKAAYYIEQLNEVKAYDHPIVTEIAPYGKFYPAEISMQDYYNQNQDVPYCRLVIQPKLEKFKKVFKDQLKK